VPAGTVSGYMLLKTMFDDGRVMRKLQDEDATPEQVKNLIFGVNAIKAPRQAGQIVRQLEAVLGPGSPEFQAIQQSALTDILMPALDAEPNWKKVVTNIDQFKRNNPTLGKELFQEETMAELTKLRNYANAVQNAAPMDVRLRDRGWERTAAVLLAGNQLARGAQRVSFISKVFGMLKPNMGNARKTQIISEVLGYNPRQSLFSTQPVKNVATMEEFRQEPETPRELANFFGGQ